MNEKITIKPLVNKVRAILNDFTIVEVKEENVNMWIFGKLVFPLQLGVLNPELTIWQKEENGEIQIGWEPNSGYRIFQNTEAYKVLSAPFMRPGIFATEYRCGISMHELMEINIDNAETNV